MSVVYNTLKLLADKLQPVGLPISILGEGKDEIGDRIVFNYIPTSTTDDKTHNNLINCNLYIEKLNSGHHNGLLLFQYFDQMKPLIISSGGSNRTGYYAFQILSDPIVGTADDKNYSILNIRITATSE